MPKRVKEVNSDDCSNCGRSEDIGTRKKRYGLKCPYCHSLFCGACFIVNLENKTGDTGICPACKIEFLFPRRRDP
ncbi:MAG: hypothetical protein Q8Q90_00935 [bacterium]|nr:hypothetical protein [bacterium]